MEDASNTPSHAGSSKGSGLAKRREPNGGKANGMPTSQSKIVQEIALLKITY